MPKVSNPNLCIILDSKEFSNFTSVNRLYNNTLRAFRQRSNTVVFDAADYANTESADDALDRILAEADVIFMLSSKYFRRERAPIPIMFFGLGSMPKGATFLFLRREKLRNIDSVLLSSRADTEIFGRILGNSAMKHYFVPFGVDLRLFNPLPKPDADSIRLKFNIPLGVPLFLYSGRVSIQKNIHTLLMLFHKVVEQMPQCRLCIAGGEDNAPFIEYGIADSGYGQHLQSAIRKYNIEEKVIMTGSVNDNDLVGLYSTADVLLNCTIHHDENFGYSQVEAMACGTPVVGSNWGGLKDTVIHGKSGYLMDTFIANTGIAVDWQSGARYALDIIRSPSLLREMSEYCIKHVEKNYSIERFADNLELVIRDTIRRRKETEEIHDNFRYHPTALGFYINSIYEHLKSDADDSTEVWYLNALKDADTYRFFVEPYTSKNASDLGIQMSDIPYFLSEVEITDRILKSIHPVSAHRYELNLDELEVALLIDGEKTVGEICDTIQSVEAEEILILLRGMCQEGILFFSRNRKAGRALANSK